HRRRSKLGREPAQSTYSIAAQLLVWDHGRQTRQVKLSRCAKIEQSVSAMVEFGLASVSERKKAASGPFFLLQNTVLVAIVLSFIVRSACAISFSGMIDGEGAEHGRIAQNLVAGIGYVGIATEGEELL